MTLFRETFIGSDFFAVFVTPSATQWVRVESSTDLVNWTERAQVIADRAHLFAEPEAKRIPRRFYRLVVPGTSLEEARRRWEALRLRDYRFRFSTIPAGAVAPSGALTFASGQKTLSDLRDAISGQPLENIDPSGIPNIDELFSIIEERTQAAFGNRVDCRVVYDPEKSFPRETTFLLNFPAAWRAFTITDFEVLSPPAPAD